MAREPGELKRVFSWVALGPAVSNALAPVVVGLFFIGSVQLFFIGVLGEYLGRIYDEVKRRPNYIVKPAARPASGAPPAPPPLRSP